MDLLIKHINRAQQLFDLKRYKECIVESRKALSIEPTDAEALGLLVNATALGNSPQDAERLGIKALEHHPEEISIYFGLGLARMRLGYYSQAIEYFNVAIKLNSFESANFINLAICLKEMNKWQKAELAINKALELSPNSDLALNIKSQIQHKTSPEKSEEIIVEAMRLAPNNGYHHKIRAKYCFEKKIFVQAAFHYQQAVKLNPLDADLRSEFLRTLVRTHPKFSYLSAFYPLANGNLWQRLSVVLGFILLFLFLKTVPSFASIFTLFLFPFWCILFLFWFGVPVARYQLSKQHFQQSNYATANFDLPLQSLIQLVLVGALGLFFINLVFFKILCFCGITVAFAYVLTLHHASEDLKDFHFEKPWAMTAVWLFFALLIPVLLLFQEEQIPTEGVI